MEIEELFCKRYPEYSVNGKPLSPYFDVFEEGYEQAEKELGEQIEKMKCCGNCKHFDKLYNRCELTRLTLKSCLCNALDKWELRR